MTPEPCSLGNCIRAEEFESSVVIWSSEYPDDGVYATRDEWSEFIAAVKRGEFDEV